MPKIIHQLWIGPRMPVAWMDTWRMDGWTYRLWDLQAVDSRTWGSAAFSYYRSRNDWVGVKDTVLPVVLHEEGGVFVDADCVRLRSWDDAPFLDSTGFAAYTEPHPGQPDRLGMSVVGAEPGSPTIGLFRLYVEELTKFEPEWDTVVPLLAKAVVDTNDYRFQVLPQGTFYPVGLRGTRDDSVTPYAEHYWATTRNLY